MNEASGHESIVELAAIVTGDAASAAVVSLESWWLILGKSGLGTPSFARILGSLPIFRHISLLEYHLLTYCLYILPSFRGAHPTNLPPGQNIHAYLKRHPHVSPTAMRALSDTTRRPADAHMPMARQYTNGGVLIPSTFRAIRDSFTLLSRISAQNPTLTYSNVGLPWEPVLAARSADSNGFHNASVHSNRGFCTRRNGTSPPELRTSESGPETRIRRSTGPSHHSTIALSPRNWRAIRTPA